MAEHCQHLSTNEREKLLNLLRKFEVTLGMWKTPLVDLELKYDTTLVCLRPYPVHTVKKAMFREKVKILVKLGVLKNSNESEW